MNLALSPLIGARPVTAPAFVRPAPQLASERPAALPATPLAADRLKLSAIPGKLPAKAIDFSDNFVKNSGGKFTIGGEPFKFVGCNMYSLTWEKPDVTAKMVADAAREGFTVIRFWANKTTPEKVKEILDLGQKHNVKFIPVLANNGSFTEAQRKDDAFYKGGYKQDYLPYVEKMVGAFKNRPEVMMWELVNEPETEAFQPLYDFSKDVSARIKQLDNNHMVSIGTIGGLGDKFGSQLSRFSTDGYRKLNSLPTLDALSIHDYSYDATALERLDIQMRNAGNKTWSARFGKLDEIANFVSRKVDQFMLDKFDTRLYRPWSVRGQWMDNNQENLQIARDLGKPLYVGEAGYKKTHGEDRAKHFGLDMKNYFEDGAQGYMMWSFQAQGRSVDGHDYGFDSKDGFAPLIQSWNQPFMQSFR